MILKPADYADEASPKNKDAAATNIVKHLQEAFSLKEKKKEDFLFEGEGSWMHPGEPLYVYDSLRYFR